MHRGGTPKRAKCLQSKGRRLGRQNLARDIRRLKRKG
jgi:hypothetical protein